MTVVTVTVQVLAEALGSPATDIVTSAAAASASTANSFRLPGNVYVLLRVITLCAALYVPVQRATWVGSY